jgi:hypothetical protein
VIRLIIETIEYPKKKSLKSDGAINLDNTKIKLKFSRLIIPCSNRKKLLFNEIIIVGLY